MHLRAAIVLRPENAASAGDGSPDPGIGRADLLVVNNTRVFPARLYGRRSGERSYPLSPHNPASRDFLQGRVEVLLTRLRLNF